MRNITSSRSRLTSFLTVLAFLSITIIGALMPVMQASAASDIPPGNKFEWVDSSTIKTFPITLLTFKDIDVTDADRTYTAVVSTVTANLYKPCSNYSGDSQTIYRLTMTRDSAGTLNELERPGKNHSGACKILTRGVTVGATDKSGGIFTNPGQGKDVTGTWINDKTIQVVGANGAPIDTLVDDNQFDSNRTFKRPGTSYCTNGEVDTVILDKVLSGKYFHLVTRTPGGGGKIACTTEILNVTLKLANNAGIVTTPCPANVSAAQCAQDRATGNTIWAQTCTASSSLPTPGSLCDSTPITPPVPGTGNNGGGATTTTTAPPEPCDSLGDFSMRWIACPILTASVAFAEKMDNIITDSLDYDTTIFDRTSAAGKAFYSAWGSFRTIALALVLIAGLIMVVSQGTGLQLVDAYTVRKVLPRLFIAVVGITLSWVILAFVITFFNDIGHWIQDIILLPFQSAANSTSGNAAATGAGIAVAITGAFLGAGAYLIAIGPIGILTLIGTVLLALLVGWLVLSIRNVIITVVILFAPLAIACYILPSTKKVFDFWQNAGITMLMVFPIIMAMIAAGKAMSLVTQNGFMKILFLLVPYFFIPFAFKLAGGLMSTVFSMVNDKNKGMFDRMSRARANSAKQRFEDAADGAGNNWLGKGIGKPLGTGYRRMQMAQQGGLGLTRNSRARYNAAAQKRFQDNAHKRLENDHGRAAGDDDATSLALQKGMTASKFVEQMQSKHGRTEAQARAALGQIETGFGARLGSDTMRIAAFKAKAASTTGYKPGDYEGMFDDANSLMADGLMTSADATAAFKQNKSRADISGVGFGTWIKQLDAAQERYNNGARSGTGTTRNSAAATAAGATDTGTSLVGANLGRELRREALEGTQPGAVLGGRHEAVTALAPEMFAEVQEALASGNPQTIGRTMAAVAGRYDVAAQVSPKNAKILATEVMSKVIVTPDGQSKSVQEYIDETMRTDSFFREMRREYGATAGQQAAAANAAGQNPALVGGTPPGTLPTPGAT